jgi:hypothetical protein
MLEDHEEPGPVSPPIIRATSVPASIADRRLRKLVVWLLVAALAGIGTTGFLLYWFLTADVRMERDAVKGLSLQAQLASVFVGSRTPEMVKLENKTWARQYYIVDPPRWDMKPTGSKAFPFEAIITVPYQRYATVYHDAKQEVELADDQFYRAPDNNSFFEEPKAYWFSAKKMHLIIELTYSPSDGWIEKSTRKQEEKSGEE